MNDSYKVEFQTSCRFTQKMVVILNMEVRQFNLYESLDLRGII